MQHDIKKLRKKFIAILLLFTIAVILSSSFAESESAQNKSPQHIPKYSKFFDEKTRWCDALVITCSDFRFTTATQEFLNNRLGLKGKYDYISIPGSIRNLLDSKTRDLVLNKFGVSVRLHRVNRVIILAHQDCTGYGGSVAFNESADEFKAISKDLKKARMLMGIKFRHLKVYLYYGTIFYDNHKRIYNFKQIL